jgi:ABC-type branched-subunit amino acid transport system substrate-binding protein
MNKKLSMIAFIGMLGIFLLGTFNVPVVASESSVNTLPSEIKLCGVFPISARPDAGPDRRDGFLMAIDEINAQTGSARILPTGVTLTGIVKDDLNTAQGGTDAANSCVSDSADLVIGSSGSTVSAAMAAVLTPLKIIQISYASSSPSLSDRTKFPYFMRNVASDADQGLAIADLVASFGWTKGATINTDDSYGNGLVSYFTAAFNQTPGFSLSAQTFPAGATDVSAQVQSISDANPQFVLLHAIDNDAKTVFKKAYDLGIAGTGSNIAWIITDGSSSTATFQGDANVKAAMQNVIGTTPTALTDTKYADFNASWFSVSTCGDGQQDPCGAARTSSTPNSYAPFAYDAVYIAAKGIAAAGTVAHTDADSKTLLDDLYAVTFTGAGGNIKFNTKGEVNGRFDYVTLNNETYSTFGQWDGTPSFTVTTMTLPNSQVYTLKDGKYTGGPGAGGIPGFEYIALVFGLGTLVAIRRKK